MTVQHTLLSHFGYQTETSAIVESLTGDTTRGALLLGASGMGKTTVANAALSMLEDSVAVYRFRGSNLLQNRELGIFEVLLSRSGASRDLTPGAALSVISRLFAAAEGDVRPVIFIDNADRVDDLSLSIAVQLAVANRVRLLIAAVAITEPVDLAARLWTGGKLVRVDIDGVDERAIEAMAKDSGVHLDSATIADYRRRSKGNPRMLRTLISSRTQTTGARRGAEARALWKVPDDQHHILDILSLAETLSYEALLTISDPGTVDELVRQGVVSITRGRNAEVSLTEPVVARILRDSVQPAQRLQLWKEVAPILESGSAQGRSAFGLVSWGQALGIPQDPRHVLRAGQWANENSEFVRAIEVLRDSHSADHEIRLELARAERGNGDLPAAWAIFNDLVAAQSPTAGSDTYVSRLACLELRLSDPRRPESLRVGWARTRLRSALDRGRLDITRAHFEISGGRIDEARRLAHAVYRDHSCFTRHRLRACATLGVAEIMSGRIEVGLEYLAQAELMFELPGMTSFEVEDAVPQIFNGRYIAGDWPGARAVLDRLSPAHADAEAARAIVDLRTGQIVRAKQILDRELVRVRNDSAVDPYTVTASAVKWADGLLRLRDEAERRMLPAAVVRSGGRLDAVPSAQIGRGPEPSGGVAKTEPTGDGSEASDPNFNWARSIDSRMFDLLALALDDPNAGAEGLYLLGEEAHGNGAYALCARMWIDSARCGHSQAARRLAEVAPRVDGCLGVLAAAVAAAVLGPGSMCEAAEEALSCGEIILCADLARTAREQGVSAGDAAGVRRARTLLDSAMRTIIFGSHGRHLRDMLTEVERSLVEGVAEGLSNAELARSQHLSVRTVEWHLSRLYRRLRVTNRGELGRIIRKWTKS